YVLKRGILQRSLDSGVLTTILVTFGISNVLENVLLRVFTANGHSLNIGSLVSDSFKVGHQIHIAYLSVIILGAAVVALAGLQVLLSKTGTGRLIRAIADDKEAAELVGADHRHIFGIAAALAFGTMALAGLALSMYSQIDPTAGPNYLIYAFEAVVIGGLGSLWGTLLGGIVLGIATTVGYHVSSNFGALGPHLVFLAVLAFRPQGLWPKRARA
ncbi:MAG: branched-chain amino acid ABC transporter permease, partial [Nocardioidaceae bacterium]